MTHVLESRNRTRYCVGMAQDLDPRETIGQRVAKYRRLQGWSAQKLADESGLTRSVITNIENGRREDLTVNELLAISVALGMAGIAIMLPIDRPFGVVEIAGTQIEVESLRSTFAGESVVLQSSGKPSAAGAQARELIRLGDQADALYWKVVHGLNALKGALSPSEMRELSDAITDRRISSLYAEDTQERVLALVSDMRSYVTAHDAFERIGGVGKSMPPWRRWIEAQGGVNDGTPADPAE